MLLIAPTPGSAMRIGETNPLADITVQDSRLAWAISNEYHFAVVPAEISYLRNQQFSYGEVVVLYGLADASNKSFESILQMRQGDNLEWTEILVRLGLKATDVSDRAALILTNTQLPADAQALTSLLSNPPATENSTSNSKKSNKQATPGSVVYNSSGKARF